MADGTSTGIFDGVVDGTALSWKVSITGAMSLTLTFRGSIDELNGTVVLWEFDNSTFLDKRPP